MGSLLNFIYDKSSDKQNGPWETCHRGPIINEIVAHLSQLYEKQPRVHFLDFDEALVPSRGGRDPVQ